MESEKDGRSIKGVAIKILPYSTHMRNNYEIRGVAYRKKTKRMVSGSDISSDGKRDTPAGDL